MEQMTTEDAAHFYARGSETVLLVEDKRSILTMAALSLNSQFSMVMEAALVAAWRAPLLSAVVPF